MARFDNQDGSALAMGAVGALVMVGLVQRLRGGSAAKNADVARAWSYGDAARNGRGNFKTDGRDLWSYDLKIGWTDERGRKILGDYTAKTDNFHSMTTSCHVGRARDWADAVVDPDARRRSIRQGR